MSTLNQSNVTSTQNLISTNHKISSNTLLSKLTKLLKHPSSSTNESLRFDSNPNQSFIFVTGEAGTGKSHLLMNVVNQLEDEEVHSTLVVAYTGYAALNVRGSTIHSGLKIQIGSLGSAEDDEEMKANALHTLEELAAKLANLKWLIIDEISLVSEHFFSIIDYRLRQIKSCPDKPFGNVNV
ncbi:ATP-dependent DNA helicase pfh1-like protein, partial [Leptotrombidium deliense]